MKSKKMHVFFFPPATWWPHPLRSTRSRPPCFAATSGDWQKSRTGKTTPKTARKRIQPAQRQACFAGNTAAYWQIRQRPPGNALSPWCALPASSTDGAAARSAHARAPFASSAAHAATRSSCVFGRRLAPKIRAATDRPAAQLLLFTTDSPRRHRPPRSATTAPQRARLADWQPSPQTAPQRNYFFLPQTAPAATDRPGTRAQKRRRHRPPRNARRAAC